MTAQRKKALRATVREFTGNDTLLAIDELWPSTAAVFVPTRSSRKKAAVRRLEKFTGKHLLLVGPMPFGDSFGARMLDTCRAFFALVGRIDFDGRGSPMHGTVIWYFGPHPRRFECVFHKHLEGNSRRREEIIRP
jgi:hypothetical protein